MPGKVFNLAKGVLSFNGRKGIVIPKDGDYTADQVGASNKDLSNLSDYQKALYNIGGKPNRNLLDDSYFSGGGSQSGYGKFPINQRGATSGTADWSEFFADRWKGSCDYRYNEDSVTISGGGYIVQSTDFPYIFPMTASVLTKTGFYWVTFNQTGSLQPVGMQGFFDLQSNYFSINFKVLTDIVSAKLEYGDKQTHCYKDAKGNWKPFEIPEYRNELSKCQCHAFSVSGGRYIGNNVEERVIVFIPTPVSMAKIPVITVTNYGGLVFSSGETKTPTSISAESVDSNGIKCSVLYDGQVSGALAQLGDMVAFFSDGM